MTGSGGTISGDYYDIENSSIDSSQNNNPYGDSSALRGNYLNVLDSNFTNNVNKQLQIKQV